MSRDDDSQHNVAAERCCCVGRSSSVLTISRASSADYWLLSSPTSSIRFARRVLAVEVPDASTVDRAPPARSTVNHLPSVVTHYSTQVIDSCADPNTANGRLTTSRRRTRCGCGAIIARRNDAKCLLGHKTIMQRR